MQNINFPQKSIVKFFLSFFFKGGSKYAQVISNVQNYVDQMDGSIIIQVWTVARFLKADRL